MATRRRKPLIALVLAVIASIASSGLALAVDRSTFATVTGGPFYFRSETTYIANWTVRTATNGDATTFYLDKMSSTASVRNGKQCIAARLCKSFTFSATAKVTYNGSPIKTYTLPNGVCSSGASDPNSVVMNKCLLNQSFVIKPYTILIPVKVTFTWSVGVYGGGELPYFLGGQWPKTTTVNF